MNKRSMAAFGARFYKLCGLGLLVLAAAMTAINPVLAGGMHYEVSVSTRLYADEQAQLAGIRMNWVYDPEVSMVILDGRDMSAAGLKKLGEDILEDLYAMGYYVQLKVNGQPVAIEKVSGLSIKLVEENSIQLGMQIALKQAQAVKGRVFELTLADPEGIAQLLYSGVDRVVLADELATQCAAPQLAEKTTVMNDHELRMQSLTVRCP